MAKDNQHFIPQGYLRGFTIHGEKSLIWEYDKNTGHISKAPKSIREICNRDKYYAQKNEDGSLDKESIENSFHEIENLAPRIIRKIKTLKTGSKVQLSDEEIGILSFFVSLLLARVPNFRDGVEDLHKNIAELTFDQIIEQQKKEGVLPASIEILYEQGDIDISVEPFVSLRPMVEFALKGSEMLLEKIWHFAIPAKGFSFVTSDNPVNFQLPEKFRLKGNNTTIGPFHPLSELSLPLRKDLLLICTPSVEYSVKQIKTLNLTSVVLDKNDTKNMNKRATLSAARYVYYPEKSEALARMVGKFKGTKQHFAI